MRPRFVTGVLALSILLCAGMWWLKKGSGANKVKNPEETSTRVISSPAVVTVARRITVRAPANNPTPEQERAAIDAQVEHLTQLSLKGDSASLPEILAALKNPDKEVREAALDAVTQVGDSNAIPVLKEASEMVDDPEEKVAFHEAMDFLAVPPLTFDASSPVSNPQPTAAAERRRAQRLAEREQENRGWTRTSPGNQSSGSVAQ
jgi:hypothetical protein